MRTRGRTVDREVRRIAELQHGVVARRQLLAAGVSPGAIGRRIRGGALLVEHAGVYRVGHRAPSVEAAYMAAVLACGPGAVLSGRAAANLLGLRSDAAARPEVTASTERRVRGIVTHRCRGLDARDRMVFRRIAVTTVARTIVDLAAGLAADELARACHEAGVRFGTTPRAVDAVLARRPNSPGAAKLRRVLHGSVPVALSALERRFLGLVRDDGLPIPQTNRRAGSARVDCRWPEHRLTVELDGYRYHRSRHAWEQDRRREREARARGDLLVRLTYGDVVERPRATLADLRGLLDARRPA